MPKGVYKRTEKIKKSLSEAQEKRFEENQSLERCDNCGQFKGENHKCPENYDWNEENLEKARRKIEELKEKGEYEHPRPWEGKERSKETKRSIRKTKKEQWNDPEYREKMVFVEGHPQYNTGRTRFGGEDNPTSDKDHWNWNGGVTEEKKKFWGSGDYQKWRKKVFERDDYTCQNCGKRGGNINAHHIVPINEDKNLAFETSNGITLCRKCHIKLHKIVGFENGGDLDVFDKREN